jgi:serine/threonine protein kinase
VYLAIDRQTGEEVAIKAMSKRRPKSTRERTLKKLVREAALQARVQHCSGVVKLLGAFEVRFFLSFGARPARPLSLFKPFHRRSCRRERLPSGAPGGGKALSRRARVFLPNGGCKTPRTASSFKSVFFFPSLESA